MDILQSPLCLILIGMNILISVMAFQNDAFMKRNLFIVGPILRQREYHRLITSGFLHANLLHLLVNMYVLWEFGPVLERIMGTPHFAALYGLSLLAGSLWSLMENRKNLLYSALGASGATSGVVMAFCFLAPQASLGLFFVIPMPAWVLALLFFGVSVWLSRRPKGVIAHDAHLGGMIMGGLYMILFEPRLWPRFISTIESAIGIG